MEWRGVREGLTLGGALLRLFGSLNSPGFPLVSEMRLGEGERRKIGRGDRGEVGEHMLNNVPECRRR